MRLAFLSVGLLLIGSPRKAPVRSPTVGTFHVELDSTLRSAAHQALGATPENRSGDGAASDTWLCYTLTDGYHLRLVSGEMSGESVGGFWIGPAAADTARGQCTRLALRATDIHTDRGLRIGLSMSRLRTALGRPTHTGPRWLEYRYDAGTVSSMITVHYRGNRVTTLDGFVFHTD